MRCPYHDLIEVKKEGVTIWRYQNEDDKTRFFIEFWCEECDGIMRTALTFYLVHTLAVFGFLEVYEWPFEEQPLLAEDIRTIVDDVVSALEESDDGSSEI